MAQTIMKHIQNRVSKKFPGVVLESPIQGFAYLDLYEEGIAQYNKLPISKRTAKDDRWAGACHFQLFNDLSAIELFYRAIARGEEAARINLAHTFNFVERAPESLSQINKVNFDKLSIYNKTLYLRVQSVIEENYCRMEQALQCVEDAWQIIQGLPEISILAPQILNQIGSLRAKTGKMHRALWYFERSLELGSSNNMAKTLLQKAHTLSTMGRFNEAKQILNKLNTLICPAPIKAHQLLCLGDVLWANHNMREAIETYQHSITFSLQSAAIYEEIYARLALGTILAKQNCIEAAKGHFERLNMLHLDEKELLDYHFRKCLLDYWRKTNSANKTIGILANLSDQYESVNFPQEQGWVKLHIAELHRVMGNPTAMRVELDTLSRLRIALQNNNFLAREWTLLPELYELAKYSHPRITGDTAINLHSPVATLELEYLGKRCSTLNSAPLNIPLRWAEIIILLCLHKEGLTAEQLLALLYGDGGKLSTLRATLSKLRQTVSIDSRPYRLSLATKADFLLVQQALNKHDLATALKLYQGPLLPASDAPGIVAQRDVLAETLRQAVLISKDKNLVLKAAPLFPNDPELLAHLLSLLSTEDPKYPQIKALLIRSKRELSTDTPVMNKNSYTIS